MEPNETPSKDSNGLERHSEQSNGNICDRLDGDSVAIEQAARRADHAERVQRVSRRFAAGEKQLAERRLEESWPETHYQSGGHRAEIREPGEPERFIASDELVTLRWCR